MIANQTEKTPCRHCGSLGPHSFGPGKGPHKASLTCAGCERLIKWLSCRSPEERAARKRQCQRDWMQTKPPTPAQLTYLARLGHHGPVPADRLAASDAIDAALRQREA
jgi:hypothetical protein